jgi:hypothetical protein
MQNQNAAYAAGRRKFLRGVVAAGGATALTAAFSSRLIANDTGGTAFRKGTEPVASRGYHETEHIREYYRTLRM